MANILKMEKRILFQRLLALGWSYRRIQRETRIRRETDSKLIPKNTRVNVSSFIR